MFIDPSGKGNPHLTDQVRMHADNEFKRIDLSAASFKHTATAPIKLTF
jgi:penicillin G amidase